MWYLQSCLAILLALQLSPAASMPSGASSKSPPYVKLAYGDFKGTTKFTGVDSFLGMPFARAGRLRNPTLLGAADKLEGIQDATQYGPACPQQELVASPYNSNDAKVGEILGAVEQIAFLPIAQQSEDCLSVNVQVPAGINSTAGLPVMYWIYGGGFELGSSAALGSESTAVPGFIYQGAHMVQRSVEMGQPIVFVSANYRLNAFGTLASQEITDADVANLVLKDQRTAMRWIQKYIHKFGGDPKKVTLFGESAGSMSISIQLLLNDGDNEGLFRGAIMASGGPAKFHDYHYAQGTFDTIAAACGCGASRDKVDCLRKAPYEKLYNAVQQQPTFFSYESTAVPWYPRADGTYLKDSPYRLMRQGSVSRVPVIIGDMRDEGTLFSLVAQLNVTNDAGYRKFFKDVFFKTATEEQVADLTNLYSEDPAKGSPFGTGLLNQIGPQYKRMAALVGDYTFESPRRDFLEHSYDKQEMWTYSIRQSIPLLGQVPSLGNIPGITGLPVLGSFHVSDAALYDFAVVPASLSKNTLNIMSTYIAFVNSLNPNDHGLKDLPHWPKWDKKKKSMFVYKEDGPEIIKDNYREKQMNQINHNAEVYMY